MIEVYEIRDLIEEEVYIGEGTVLGVTDAANVVVNRFSKEIATLSAQNAELIEALEILRSVAHSAVGYISAANYPERETQAHNRINKYFDEVLAKVKP